jgi:anthranilate synthase component 1
MTTIKTELKPTVRRDPRGSRDAVSAFLKLKGHGARFLLESVEMGENLGRYSFIGLDYLRNIKVLPDQVDRGGERPVRERSRSAPQPARDPAAAIMAPLALTHDSLPGLVGGAVGYIGYDFVRFIERLPSALPDPLGCRSATSTSPRRWSSSTT